jgi:ribosome-associated protein
MVEAGIAAEPRLEASRLELDRPGPSYTVETLEELTEHEPAAELTLVLSAESFAGLRSWRDPDRILELARIAVAPRAAYPAPDAATVATIAGARADRVVVIAGPQVDVSASAIRRAVAAGEPIDGLVPPGVAEVIARHRLYRDPQPQEDRPNVTDPAPLSGTPAPDAPPISSAPRPDGLPTRGAAAAAAAAAAVVPAADRAPLDIARRIVELAEDKKAADIVLLDLTGLTTLADAFVICSGGSERQLDAIADGIIEGLRAEKIRPIGREGTPASHWVLIDFGAVVVHVFTPPEREYYSLEKHWSEAKTILRVQ